MPQAFQDEFDTASGVGGKHLAPKKPIDYIVSFLTLTFLSATLAGGGIVGLQLWDAGVILSGLVAQQEDAVPQMEVAIVDGTNTGKAISIGEQLADAGWNIVSATSLADQDPGLEAATSTLIFLSSEAYRADAAGLLATFPGAPITVSDQFPTPVTVLIGTDFAG
ncbi:MAG: hypothetical protein RLZZ610_12 [Actinomycetota bacterium]|jgi:hypothetical protein